VSGSRHRPPQGILKAGILKAGILKVGILKLGMGKGHGRC
jgi:hypothetical protein